MQLAYLLKAEMAYVYTFYYASMKTIIMLQNYPICSLRYIFVHFPAIFFITFENLVVKGTLIAQEITVYNAIVW